MLPRTVGLWTFVFYKQDAALRQQTFRLKFLRENSVNIFAVIKINKEACIVFNFYPDTIIPNSYSVTMVISFKLLEMIDLLNVLR